MMNRKQMSQQVLLVTLVALMLAVPFSCLLGKAVVWCFEPRGERRLVGRAMPLPAGT